MNYPPARCEMRLRFPVELPGGTIDAVHIDLDRPGKWRGDLAEVSRITGLPTSVLHELVEFDYVRILLKIEEMNAPRLTMMEAVR